MYRVLIAEDQPLVRDGIKLILEQDKEINVVGLASNGKEAFEICKNIHVNLVLMDIMMDGCDGIEGTKLIKTFNTNIKVLALTTFCDKFDIMQILHSGVDGCISKSMESAELILSVKGVVSGLKVLHHDVFSTLLNHSNYNQFNIIDHSLSIKSKLTKNELDILKLIVLGKKNEEISEDICLSEGRVRNVITEMLIKFGLDNRTQLAVFAVKNKLI